MAASDYHLITRWHVPGQMEDVYTILSNARSYTRWWSDVFLDVRELDSPRKPGMGPEVSVYSKAFLPYTLRWRARVIEARPPLGFTLEAAGDFVGRGTWSLRQEGRGVEIVFDWKVRVHKPLLRRLSFLLKPLFVANHAWAMRRGLEGLLRELEDLPAALNQPLRALPVAA
jgi:hypothetical protein